MNQMTTEISATSVSLKDMPEEQFQSTYDCDRFTATVLGNRFRYVVDAMSKQLMYRAFSPILRDATDLSAALSGPGEINWPMPAVAQTIPLFFGSIADAVKICLEEYGVENLAPGDVVIVNDPYRAGTHLNDVCFIRPVFADGEMVAALTLRAHMLDWGGKTQGGFSPNKASLYEDGLTLAPDLIYRAGKPVQSLFKIIRDNTRFPDMVIPDIQTMNSCLEEADALLVETFERYGKEAFHGAMRYACDASAETMSNALATLPDGDFEGEARLDSNGLGGIETACMAKASLRKRGDKIEVDFSGTSSANASSLNCMWQEARTAVALALKWLVDPVSPYTSATCRNVDVLVPPDSFINPSPPHCSNLYWVPVHVLMTAILRALNPVLAERAIALESGDNVVHAAWSLPGDNEGEFYTFPGSIMMASPWGATQKGDGDSSQLNPYINLIFGGDESVEAEQPFVVLSRDYLIDSAGPGYHRGGASSVVDSLWPRKGQHTSWVFMSNREDGGAFGGSEGHPAGAWAFPPDVVDEYGEASGLAHALPRAAYEKSQPFFGLLDPQSNEPKRDGEYNLQLDPVQADAGSILRFIPAGGGGWGNPLERPADKVLEDVRNEYVSIAGAKRDYGVIITGDPMNDPEGLQLNEAETAALRKSRLAA